jgi:DeoR family transcriptional regulator of aga operon
VDESALDVADKEMTQEQRHQKTLFMLKKHGTIAVNDLSRLFGVSQVTIRADLNELERQGLIIRKYGGAMLPPDASRRDRDDPSPASLEARSIAKVAATLVEDGDVLFLDGRIECVLLADCVANRRDLVIVTTSLEIAYKLARTGDFPVYLAGGKVDSATLTVAGDLEDILGSKLRITKAFFGSSGASPETGFSDSSLDEANAKRLAVEKAGEVVVLFQSSRWGRLSLAPFAALASVDVVVTDVDAPAAMVESLHAAGVRVSRAEVGDREASGYARFGEYRAHARAGIPYAHSPGKGRRIAFANGKRSEPLCADVERGFLAQAALAGFPPDSVLVLDNDYDPERAVANARRVVEWRSDVLVEFNTDARSNHVVADLCKESGIPILALDCQVPAAPYVGNNNWGAGTLAGDYAASLIKDKFGGWDAVDLVLLFQLTTGGESIILRTEGFAASLEAAFGEAAERKIVRLEGGNDYGTAHAAALSFAAGLDPAGRYVMSTVNVASMQGAVDALASARVWSADRFISVSHGCDELGLRQLKAGLVDGAVAYHPERYGTHIVPMACALMEGLPVPPYEYVDIAVLTPGEVA